LSWTCLPVCHSTRSGGLVNIDRTYGHLAQDGHAHASSCSTENDDRDVGPFTELAEPIVEFGDRRDAHEVARRAVEGETRDALVPSQTETSESLSRPDVG
jgi:hypothetical protein